MYSIAKLLVTATCVIQSTAAIEVDWQSPDSIKSAASTMVWDMMSVYKGNLSIPGAPPGLLPDPPYAWWLGGAMWGTLINYWHFTGDSTYNRNVREGLQRQRGAFDDFMPQEHRSSIGNDDQSFWAISAMTAVEYGLPDSTIEGEPSWLALVQAVFNEQVGRWDTTKCGGGLRWQTMVKNGWSFKNTISNGCFFHIAARLARYTGDQLYADWANKSWDWLWTIGLIDNANYNVYDGSEADTLNCTEFDHNQWTYNSAVLLYGTAVMYNFTDGSPIWRNRTARLLQRIEEVHFQNTTAWEICEPYVKCNDDQKSFKAYLARWMTQTSQLAPFTFKKIHRLLGNSAKMAAQTCIGGPRGTSCGMSWTKNGTYDGEAGRSGVGQQMSALEMTLSVLVSFDDPEPDANSTANPNRPKSGIKPPVTNTTGGTSASNPDAGHNPNEPAPGTLAFPVMKKDKIGAWVLTVVLALAAAAGCVFLSTRLFEYGGTKPTVGGVAKGGRSEKTKTVEMMRSASVRESVPPAPGTVAPMETVEEETRPEPRYRGGSMIT